MLRKVFLCLALIGFAPVLMAPAAWAQDGALKRLDTGDDSRGWEAVGRLEINGTGFCTGALIDERLVLTAAHCLYDKATGQRIDHAKVEFRAGWRYGRAEAYRAVRRAVVHPEYSFDGHTSPDKVSNDVALLELQQPIRTTSVTPFATDIRPRKGARVGVVSYAHDRADAPSLQEICSVMGRQQGVLVMSCNVDFGSSGAPVFSFDDGGVPRIVSVVSAKAEVEGQHVALGTQLEEPLMILRQELAEGRGVFLDASPRENGFVDADKRRKTGAKFVKP